MKSPTVWEPAVRYATATWYMAEEGRFEFCCLASNIVGKYEEGAAQALADGIKRSLSTVQDCAMIGKLYESMSPQDAEKYRSDISYSFWPPVARLWANKILDMAGVKHWFDEALLNDWTVEKFRGKLPSVSGKSVWIRSANSFVKMIAFIDEELINAPALDVDEKKYGKVIRALKLARGRIREAIK